MEFGVVVCFYRGMFSFLDVSFSKRIIFFECDFSFGHYWRLFCTHLRYVPCVFSVLSRVLK